MTADQAKAVAEALTRLWEGEVPATSQVLEAVKDDNREHTPDLKSRTAWQLAAAPTTS